MRFVIIFLVAFGLGCGSSTPEQQCEAAGGACVLGSLTCFGSRPAVDCNPDRNPGGFYCCAGVVCPVGETPDGGADCHVPQPPPAPDVSGGERFPGR